MGEEVTRSRLGRGLAALIGDVGSDPEAGRERTPRHVPVEFVRPNPSNPRRHFGEGDLDELSASIRERGIIQPIIVRAAAAPKGVYEIIAGERRWRAAQLAGLHEIPVVVVEADDRTALELAIIENIQRTDLNALEEAAGYQKLIAEFGYSQAELAGILGRSRSHLANMLRLLKLPDPVKALLAEGTVSAGHARALLAVNDPEAVAARIVARGLNVRDVERIAQAENAQADRAPRQRGEKDSDTRALESALEDLLGLRVAIDHRNGGGELRIRYASLDQLDALCRRLRMSAAA